MVPSSNPPRKQRVAKNAFSITLASQGCRNKLPQVPCLKCNTNELNTVLEVKSPNGGSLGCQQGDIPCWRLCGGGGGDPCLMVSSAIFKAAMLLLTSRHSDLLLASLLHF